MAFRIGVNMSVSTKQVERRECRFDTLAELSNELDTIEQAHALGNLRHSGNWSVGMIFEHVAKAFEMSIDGFPGRARLPLRIIISALLKKRLLRGENFPAGIKAPPKFLITGDPSAVMPSESTSFDQGLQRLRDVIARIEQGAKLEQPNPVFGKLAHEESVVIQLRHAGLHLGFIHTDQA